MTAEDGPFPGTETLHQRNPLFFAEVGVGVHRGHEDGRVAVVLGLFRGHAVDVHVYIAGYRLQAHDDHAAF